MAHPSVVRRIPEKGLKQLFPLGVEARQGCGELAPASNFHSLSPLGLGI